MCDKELLFSEAGRLHAALQDVCRAANWSLLERQVASFEQGLAQGDALSEKAFEVYGVRKGIREKYASLVSALEFARDYAAEAAEDPAAHDDAREIAHEELAQAARFMLSLSMLDPHDGRSAYITIEPAAKREIEQEFSGTVAKAYCAFAERCGLKAAIIDQNGSITLRIGGAQAYGLFRGEHGVHRIEYRQRGKTQTARLSVTVEPELPLREEGICERDFSEEFLAAGGPGGQRANAKETRVRITHIQTGLQATARMRSQSSSRKVAYKRLHAKIAAYEEREAARATRVVERIPPIWGHNMRNYDLEGGSGVSDRRFDARITLDEFSAGRIDPFILRYHGIAFTDVMPR